jgi:hypothetical protein
MHRHTKKNRLSRKRVFGLLGLFGIPKDVRFQVIEIMEEKKLLKKVNRDKIEIINIEKSKDVDKTVLEDIWRGIILGK